jgi:hypothetical protein
MVVWIEKLRNGLLRLYGFVKSWSRAFKRLGFANTHQLG